LEPLLSGYSRWIEEEKAPQVADLPADLQPVASQHLGECRAAHDRIRSAIELLAQNPEAFEAFRFANGAMLLQRSHTEWAAARRKTPQTAPESPSLEGRWRPFQLAFILLNLP